MKEFTIREEQEPCSIGGTIPWFYIEHDGFIKAETRYRDIARFICDSLNERERQKVDAPCH